jgi:hypothetical protein
LAEMMDNTGSTFASTDSSSVRDFMDEGMLIVTDEGISCSGIGMNRRRVIYI